MKPLNLREYAESLRLQGNPFADEILRLCDWRQEVEPIYLSLIYSLEYYARGRDVPNDPEKQLEWLGDREKHLQSVEDLLAESGRNRDADDEVRDLIDTHDDLRTELQRRKLWNSEGLLDSVTAMLDIATYDL